MLASIEDFSEIARPLCRLLEKDTKFDFNEACRIAFEEIRERPVIAHVIATPDWNKNFEIMGDASDFAMGALMGQRIENTFKAIYYTSKTFNEAQENYSTTNNVTPQKYPRIFIIILLYIQGMN